MSIHYKEKLLPIKYWIPIRRKRHLEKLKFQDQYLFNLYGISLRSFDYTSDIINLTAVNSELSRIQGTEKKKLKLALRERLNECNPNCALGIKSFTWTLLIGGISSLAIVCTFINPDTTTQVEPSSSFGIIIIGFAILTILMCISSLAISLKFEAYAQHANYQQRLLDIMDIYEI